MTTFYSPDILLSAPSKIKYRTERYSRYLSSQKFNEYLGQSSSRGRQTLTDPEQEETCSQLCLPLISSEAELSEHIDWLLQMSARLKDRKRDNLYYNWSERVFSGINDQLKSKINSELYITLDEHKRDLYNYFIKLSNTRPVYLESPDREHYTHSNHIPKLDPILASNKNDPLLSRQVEYSDEQEVLGSCLSKHTLNYLNCLHSRPVYPLRHSSRNNNTEEFGRIPLYFVDSPQRHVSQCRLTHHADRNQTNHHLSQSYGKPHGSIERLVGSDLENVLTNQMRIQRKKLFHSKGLQSSVELV